MILCLCHGLSERQIRAACAVPEVTAVACVYRYFGCRPQCGKCVPLVRDMLRDARIERGDREAAADAAGPGDADADAA
ncbi:MAG TPA: (2Fe-2S)-binding protein [Geminicoccaceae bacterium]|nr:(2Fe-2S)-binding protein [Geminicoccaceae bacterium]